MTGVYAIVSGTYNDITHEFYQTLKRTQVKVICVHFTSMFGNVFSLGVHQHFSVNI